jgi:O-antigen ligase
MGKRSREKRERREQEEIRPKREMPETGFVSICKKIILFGTFLILFTPLIVDGDFFFPFVGPKSIYFMGLVLIVFTAYLLLIFINAKYRPKLNLLLIALSFFIVVSIISTFLGENPSYSFWSKYERMTGLLMLFHLLAFFVVISSVFKSQKDWFKIFGVSIFVAFIISLISLIVKVNPPQEGILAISQGGATIGNSSFLGTYLLFNIFLALYLFLKTAGGLKIYSTISLIIIFLALLVSDARAAILSLLGGLILLFFLWLIFSQKRILKIIGASLLVLFIISSLFVIYLMFQPDSFVHNKLMQMGFGGRFVVWQSAWQGFLERPWFGWGLENFELAFTRHFNPMLFLPKYGGEVWFDRAHNIILDTLVTTGIIGLLAYLGIFIAVFYLLWSRYFKEKISFWTAGIFSSLLIAYFVQNLTVFDMVSSFMMFFLVLGFVASITSQKNEKAFIYPQRSLNPLIAIIILVFFSLSFFHFVIQPFRAGHYVIEALGVEPGSPEKISLYKKTLETSPLGREQIRIFFADAVTGFSRTEDGMQTKQERPENFIKKYDFLSQELEKSIKESPLDLRSHLTLGKLYTVYARLNPEKLLRAEEVLRQAIELSPINPQTYWLLAQVKLYQGDFETALYLTKKAVEIEPRIERSHFILVQVAMIIGEMELAREKAKEAIKINPDWQPALEQILGEEI